MPEDHVVGPDVGRPDWSWVRADGPVDRLVAAEVPHGVRRTVRVVEVAAPVLVLGSTQPDPRSARWPTVRRRSGGGGVLLVPGEVLWVDVLIPRDDPWWDDDVGRAAHVIGEAWATTLAGLDTEAEVHRGPLLRTPWSGSLCFAGLGPGEVTVKGRKVVGIAQRRTRGGACFQCAVSLVAPSRSSVDAVGLAGEDAAAATAHLAHTVGAVDHGATAVEHALQAVLRPGPGPQG